MTLADQLRLLRPDPITIDPESAYASLEARASSGDRGHNVDVGPSRLRGVEEGRGKYGGERVRRVKIFDDDESEEEERLGGEEEEDDDEEGENHEMERDEEVEDEDEDGEDDEDNDEDEDAQDEGSDGQDDHEEPPGSITTSTTRASLDPLAAIRESRVRDAAKGRAIRHQKVCLCPFILHRTQSHVQRYFESLISLRIAFQKAMAAAARMPHLQHLPEELDARREEVMVSLMGLNEKLLQLREMGSSSPQTTVKRKRTRREGAGEYWRDAAVESLQMSHS